MQWLSSSRHAPLDLLLVYHHAIGHPYTNRIAQPGCPQRLRSTIVVCLVAVPFLHQVARRVLANEQLQQELQHQQQEQRKQVEVALKERQDALERVSSMQQQQREMALEHRQREEGSLQLPLSWMLQLSFGFGSPVAALL